MCCNFPTIKITEGNAFTLIFQLKRRSYVAERPIDEDIDVTRLSDVHVTLGGVEYAPTIETYGVRIDVPATLARGTYDGLLTADYDGNAIHGAYESCVQVVAWNAQSNAQQYILGSPVATKAAYVLGYMPTDAEVEELKQQLREQIAAAEHAEAEAIAEKERYAEAIEHLDDIAQESTLTQGVADIRNDIANIDIDTTTLAKETTAQQAATDAAAAKTAAQSLTSLDSDINAGKSAIALAVSGKGVPTSSADTMLQMAANIRQIAQSPITIDGGEMYAKQLFGSLTTPNYWNLYDVLAQLLSDGRLLNYGGILLAEYFRGYDSIALSGAGSGGAYVVSDMDSNGNFIMYTEDVTHTWATEFDGKGNRWVAYCFNGEYHDFQITDTNTNPRSIFIGRKVGTITCLATSRTTQIVVPDGNDLIAYDGNNFVPVFDRIFTYRNGGIKHSLLYRNAVDIAFIELSNDNSGAVVQKHNANGQGAKSLILKSNIELNNLTILYSENQNAIPQTEVLIIDADGSFTISSGPNGSVYRPDNMKEINIIAEYLTLRYDAYSTNIYHLPSSCKVTLSYRTNDKSKSIKLTGTAYSNVQDFSLETGWCKTLDIASFGALTKENVQDHIFDRLGVNNLSTGAVTITLATAVLNLFTQEEIDAVVARTNITIVGA